MSTFEQQITMQTTNPHHTHAAHTQTHYTCTHAHTQWGDHRCAHLLLLYNQSSLVFELHFSQFILHTCQFSLQSPSQFTREDLTLLLCPCIRQHVHMCNTVTPLGEVRGELQVHCVTLCASSSLNVLDFDLSSSICYALKHVCTLYVILVCLHEYHSSPSHYSNSCYVNALCGWLYLFSCTSSPTCVWLSLSFWHMSSITVDS